MKKDEEDFEAKLTGDKERQEEEKKRWFSRKKKGILTTTSEKKETPEAFGQNARSATL